jgi:S-adenosylmethionine-diacylglycerol 3-amino-3-carboxypropyl transferase
LTNADRPATEVSAHADFSILRYAQCWEDADLLVRALRPAMHHHLLSIASAGDNTLALLAHGPMRVVAVDLSPAQIAALELRVAAYRHLDYPDMLALLGVEPSARRAELYARIRMHLSGDAQRYWDHHHTAILSGIIDAGRFERYLRLFRQHVLPWMHGPAVQAALFQPRSLVERCQFYATTWDTWRWRWTFRLFFSRPLLGRLGRDPAFFRYVHANVPSHLLARARDSITLLDPTKNPYLQWILLGRFTTALPAALRPENFQPIRRNLDRLEWHTCALESYLQQTQTKFHGFNLSNIFEYMSLAAYHALLEQLVEASPPQARLVYWNLLATRRRPESMRTRLASLDNLADILHRKDRTFFYSALIIEQVI